MRSNASSSENGGICKLEERKSNFSVCEEADLYDFRVYSLHLDLLPKVTTRHRQWLRPTTYEESFTSDNVYDIVWNGWTLAEKMWTRI